MHDSPGELWREWGRSLAMADVTVAARGGPPTRGRVARRSALPLPRVLLRAGVAGSTGCCWRVRLALLAALRALLRAPRGVAFWLSPLADPARRGPPHAVVGSSRRGAGAGGTTAADEEQQADEGS